MDRSAKIYGLIALLLPSLALAVPQSTVSVPTTFQTPASLTIQTGVPLLGSWVFGAGSTLDVSLASKVGFPNGVVDGQKLYDGSHILAADFGVRHLVAPNGTTVPIDWSNNTTLSFFGGGSTGATITPSVFTVSEVLSPLDSVLYLIGNARIQQTVALTGIPVYVIAGDARAGSSTPGASDGGQVIMYGGNAAQLTSGSGVGGDIQLNPGTGIGGGRNGRILANGELVITTGVADTGLYRNAASTLEANNGTPGQWATFMAGVRDAGTVTVTNGLILGHQSTGTPAANFGSGILFNADTNGATDRNAGEISAAWSTATDASRTAYLDFQLVNNAAALASKMRLFPSGGLSVNSTTDPTTGWINDTAGYKINGTQISAANLSNNTTGTAGTAVVLATSPTLVTPVLGTPTSGTLTNCTGYNTGNLTVVPNLVGYKATAVNFNVTNTDTTITITFPTGYTRWRLNSLTVSHPSTTFSTATFGLFSAASGGGTALLATSPTTAAFTSSAEGTNGNLMTPAIFANAGTQSFNTTSVFFRLITANGSAATADVTVSINLMP